MKSTVFLTIILMLFFITSSKAQTVKELAKMASEGLCSCVNETYSDIDNDVKRAMARIIKYQIEEDKEELEHYVAKLPTDLTVRIETQASLLEENDDLFQMCLDDMEGAMGDLDFEEKKYKGVTEEKFMAMMIEEIKEATDCKFAYILMELGLQVQEEENDKNNQVRISQNRSNKSAKGSSGNRKKYEGTGGN
jgi:hypothetical protein